jgi:hypothetical protein
MHRTTQGAPAGQAATAAAGGLAAPGLDQREVNRKFVEEEVTGEGWCMPGTVHVGGYVAQLARSGGAFDPEGGRFCDWKWAQDLVTLVDRIGEGCGRRWYLVTLTTVRKEFHDDPEAAWSVANERVRKALGAAGRIWVCTMELQERTGAGFCHYHSLVCVEEPGSSEASVKRQILSRWRFRPVDRTTGELLRPITLGWVDVQHVRTRKAAAIYVSKYVTKRWSAVAPWMLRRRERFRKFRRSTAALDVLVQLQLHDRRQGSRRPPSGRRFVQRTLAQRMASSGSELRVFRIVDRWGRREFVRTLPIHRDRLRHFCRTGGLGIVRLGQWRKMIFSVSPALLGRKSWAAERERQRQWLHERREYLEELWWRHQSGPERATDERAHTEDRWPTAHPAGC